jgi:stage V sporulation protein SpoVS
MTTNNVINAPLPLTPAQGGSGLASPTAHGILIAEGASNYTPLVLTAGQIPIGTTSGDPAGAQITGSGNITVTSTSGAIAISATGAGAFSWINQNTSSVTMAVNTGYITNNGASLVTYTLPVTAAQGSVIEISGLSSGSWTIAQGASQLIHLGNQVTTTGASGSLSSSNQYDSLRMVCVTANTTWNVLSAVGNITYV